VRVLFLTHRLPYAPNRGDRVRAYMILRTLAPRFDVELVSLVHDDDELAQVPRIDALGARVSAFKTSPIHNHLRAAFHLAGSRPLTHCLLDAPGLLPALHKIVQKRPPDVVLAYCSGMARLAFEEPLSPYPLVIDLVDVDSAKWGTLARAAAWPRSWVFAREAKHLAAFERRAARKAITTLVVNDRERNLLQAMAPDAAIRVVPNGVAVDHLRPPSRPTDAPHVVFCGVMNYQPNVQGVLWFAREVWPLVRARHVDAQFTVVGSQPTTAIRKLASQNAGITVTGSVPDVREYLWEAAVSVAPLLTARGLQNKVLEAIAAGLPTVVTTAVADGLPRRVLAACSVADHGATFAERVLELLSLSGAQRRSLASHADLDHLRWDVQLAPIVPVLEQAAANAHVA